MTEKFDKKYRRFAEAAKGTNSVTSKSDRKLIRENPDFLLFGRSDRLKKEVPRGAFASFFRVLQGDHNIDPRTVLKIGNFLYGHRPDKRNEENEKNPPLSPEDRPLMDLACTLVEDAFYSGDLLDLPKEHGAALAFTVNVIAKILEQRSSGAELAGFDRQKFRHFLNAVIEFEKRYYDRVIQREEDRNEEGRLHRLFLAGAQRAGTFSTEKYTLAYWIKNVLMVDNRLGSIPERERRAEEEDNLRAKYFKEPGVLSGEWPEDRTLMYSMLTHRITDSMPQGESNYAGFHFLEEDIPLAVWTLRYLRSKKRQKRPEIHSM
ncbi:hypothetical protein A3F27_01425 [Candidatus Kaiserbacteria bacterium RIFCSPHIGHO2_12_FULL_53_13]|uniref:Uncharacterized protein n=1 Tax=Candidatus Kaiserbacteria bacterium RIFCSPHIGHO2_12_FULL_53_13 TaxID=1798502 RepID=A0A1F6E6H5_9BACT|nr:MAG: hypothetical protein A3F27_01425 [Candidatus Kaiserbacteria bacterium RIFCSPHIGHO2_12_FULL_53_13]OGG74213.1 MAG: hypothetical protein A3A37_00440 [Candidatus Kaiserbacteria bacterium RIFCSPLOWO2_01_FULL_52_36]